MNATELVARMCTVYASTATYADRGTASASVGRLRVTFLTSFIRGRRLRFEFSREPNSRVIWSDGEHTYTYWPLAAQIGHAEIIDDGSDIGLAIAAVNGASSFTASIVPALLLPVSVGTAFSAIAGMSELNLEGDEYIGRYLCARIDARRSGTALTRIWVDRDTYLLRRIITFRGSELETTTSYEPSLDPIDVESIERPDVERIQPQPRRPIPWTGVEIETDSSRVESIEPGSPATRSSLAVGDEVEAVNGRRTNGFSDFLDVLREVNVGEQLTLTIRRGDDTREILIPVEAAPLRVTASRSSPLVE